jgi:hypothetical protein
MGKKISGQGWFAVKIEMRGTRAVAVLTGDHFGPDERDIANAVAGVDGRESAVSGGSPVYLVKDSVVRVAIGVYRQKQSLGLSDCHDGLRGKPCGRCTKCMEARERMFTRVVLGALDLPENELSKKLRESIQNVIGLSWSDAPWSDPMTDEEVEAAFEELGVTPVK